MWIRPDRVVRARMPSLRDQAPSSPRTPSAPAPSARPAAPAAPTPPAARKGPPAVAEPERDADETRDGGFHESSYELRTGMDMFEADWPEDTTIPGAFDDE
jgi:hypothetical protein